MLQRAMHASRSTALATALAVAAMSAAAIPAQAADPPASPASAAAPRHHRGMGVVDSRTTALANRVQLMAKELDLDSSQQQQLTAILIAQQGEVAKAWSDPSVPAALRINATQRISERTGDRIRAMLTDAQREKYIKVHPHDTPVGAPGADLDKWMPPAAPAAPDSH